MSDLEKREIQFSAVQDRGESLVLQHHPAAKCIEAYMAAMQTQWAWLLQLTLCLETHLKHASVYHHFFREVREAEEWITKYVLSEKWLDGCLGCLLMHCLVCDFNVRLGLSYVEVLLTYHCTLHCGWISQPTYNFLVLSPAFVKPGCSVQQEICILILLGASYHRRRWIHHDAPLLHIQWTQAHVFSWQSCRQLASACCDLLHFGCEIKHGTISAFFQCWLCLHSLVIDWGPSVNAIYIISGMAGLEVVLQPVGGFGQVSLFLHSHCCLAQLQIYSLF